MFPQVTKLPSYSHCIFRYGRLHVWKRLLYDPSLWGDILFAGLQGLRVNLRSFTSIFVDLTTSS